MTGVCLVLLAGMTTFTLLSTGVMQPTDANRDRLAALVGDWTVDVVYVIGGREQRGSATMRAEWVLNRHFVRQDYNAPMGAMTLATWQFVGFDPIRRKFTMLKMDSVDDAMLYADGELSADGRSVTFVGERSDMMTRTTGRLRQVLTFVDTDHFTLEWFLTANGVETKTVSMVHTRKSP